MLPKIKNCLQENPPHAVANMLDYNIIGSELKILSYYYIHF